MRLHPLRETIGLVTQRPVLFSAPLRDNLLDGRPDATEEEMREACEAAGVDAFVDELPDGYDTLIGERGVNLSGGQRQRVALARVLLSHARVLVLDDPLSAVDTETERALVGRLRPAVAGRTVLIATQRLSTVQAADRAVVLVGGKIVEQGRPDQLLTAGGPFAAPVRRGGWSRLASHRAGLLRLGEYITAPRRHLAVLFAAAGLTAAAQAGGWLLVKDAVDNGMRAGDEQRLWIDVVDLRRHQRDLVGARLVRRPRSRGGRPGDRARAAPRTCSGT